EAAGQAEAVEVFQQLNAALASQADAVAEGGGADHAGFAFDVQQQVGQLARCGFGIEEVPDHLLQRAEASQFAQQVAYLVFTDAQLLGHVAYPGWIELAGFEPRPQPCLQGFFFVAQAYSVLGQEQPGAAGSYGPFDQRLVPPAVDG